MRRDNWAEEFYRNRGIFDRYNRARIDYLRRYLPEKKRDVFDLIPFLLHEDRADLPGNELGATPPSGVSCFSYSQHIRALVKRHFPWCAMERQAKRSLPIVFVALMGSAGSIAFTEESDMDFWIGIEASRHDPADIDLLKEKFRELERWAARTASLEAHFFIADLDRIRREDYGEVSHESCGSTLGKLLKDEFYRTGLFVVGRVPFYWLMPVGTNDTYYRDYIVKLEHVSDFPNDGYVDLGTIHRIEQSEYFGAALWQLLKGLHRPFKSVLKMALLDRYALGGDAAVPLCEEYKDMVLSAEGGGLDPYVFLIERLRAFYDAQGLAAEKRLVEQCFLMRSLLASGPALVADDERFAAFRQLGESWGWCLEELAGLADFQKWEPHQHEGLRKLIIAFLLDAYKRIRKRTQRSGVRISDRDLTVVGKKLVSFFKQEDGKVPFEHSLLGARDIAVIEVREHRDRRAHLGWVVELRARAGGRPRHHLSRRVPNPAVACAWCSLNRLYHNRQQVRIHGQTPLGARQAIALIEALDAFFPAEEADSLNIEELLSERYITHLYVLPNWDCPDSGHGLSSVLALYRTTMGELFFDSHGGANVTDWLFREVLAKRVGRAHMGELRWAVHVSKGAMSSTRVVSDRLASQVREFVRGVAGGVNPNYA
ncbi:MAG: hypothetical protein GF418_17525 [Chitinivibrionales bacterium]|nr:hypothetical protein [Chitinivibrionales bacterium]MBD3397422.1 hypothetical protein [Chitinivibrionales bacterium]